MNAECRIQNAEFRIQNAELIKASLRREVSYENVFEYDGRSKRVYALSFVIVNKHLLLHPTLSGAPSGREPWCRIQNCKKKEKQWT